MITSRLCPYFKDSMFPVRDDSWFLPFPPLRDSSGRLVLQHILLVSSLRLSFLPPLRPLTCISASPLQCMVPPIVRPPLSVRQRATNPLAPADQFPLLVSRPSVPFMQASTLPPPPNLYGWWYLAWVCVCVEGRKEMAPCSVLSLSSCQQASPDRHKTLQGAIPLS